MSELSTLRRILRLLQKIGIRPAYFIVPVVVGMLAAAFEGISFGLLIPMLNGFLSGDFSFITENALLRPALDVLPITFRARDWTLFGTLMALFIAAVLCKNILRYCSEVSLAFLAERANHHLRKLLFGRYLSFGKRYFDQSSVGHHSAVLTEFSRNTLRPLQTLDKHLNALFSLVAYLIIMASISWKFTLFAIPLFFVLHIVVRGLLRRIRTLSKAIAERSSSLNRKTIEILSTLPLIKAYSMEAEEKRRYAVISDDKSRFDFRSLAWQQLMLPIQEIVTMTAAVSLFCVMIYIVIIQKESSATSFLVYFYLVVNASSKFGTLSSFRGNLANALGAVEEVEHILNESDKEYVVGGNEEFAGLKNEIVFKDLHFSYNSEREILKGISFTVQHGKLTAIVGPTGSGKSTLINLLMRYYDCPPHSIFFDEKDIRSFRLDSLLRGIALVSQETLLLHESLRYNIAYGLENVQDAAVAEVVRRARLEKFVSQLPNGLDTIIGDRGMKLSGGEKQRVAIARALLKGASILIFDEATSSLDSQTERLIQEAIDEAIQGRTAIVIAHRLSTIKHADNIVVIRDGICAEEGTLDQLIVKKGVFHALWEGQRFV